MNDVFRNRAYVYALMTVSMTIQTIFVFAYNYGNSPHPISVINEVSTDGHLNRPKGGGVPDFKTSFSSTEWKLIDHVPINDSGIYLTDPKYILVPQHLNEIVHLATHKLASRIAKIHGIPWRRNIHKSQFASIFHGHSCEHCYSYTSVLAPRKNHVNNQRQTDVSVNSSVEFPPSHPSDSHMETIIENFCREYSPDNVVEEGCAVCAQLTPMKNLTRLDCLSLNLEVLKSSGITRKERFSSQIDAEEIKEPILAPGCTRICKTCEKSINKGGVPRFALANGLWIGEIPLQLQGLTLIEKLMIARVRHNACYATVASGGRKLKCNVVAFECNMPKVYSLLPPAPEDLNNMIAVMFSGPTEPNESDWKRTPFAVRRRKVAAALEWLTLNHPDYRDVAISKIHLQQYPEHGVPVDIVKYKRSTNRDAENVAVYDNDDEDGTEAGKCPTVIHGLIDSPESKLTASQLKAKAIAHWNQGGAALRMGRSKDPVSSFGNPSWWAQMFPWLFPYGLGTIGSTPLSPKIHKRFLMLYYDKRFQLDELFTLIAFNHEQIRSASDAGFLTVDKPAFSDICDRLMSVNDDTLVDLANRMANGENVAVKPNKTEEEKKCFQILKDLDHINGKVPGSVTSKKWMRNEIWSMVNHHGAPLWYVTLNPADKKHPLCLYWCSKDLEYRPYIDISDDDCHRLIAENPVAGARFFDFMISNFLKHVLGMENNREGYFGRTKAYYGTVEQQGRLSLHLHMLIWIEGALSPEETKKRIMDPTSEFRKSFVSYLEEHHQGSFMNSNHEDVLRKVEEARAREGYRDPTTTLPEPPARKCTVECGKCSQCNANLLWRSQFEDTVNDLLLKSNLHICRSSLKKDGSRKKNSDAPGCLDNPWRKCKARMPRPIHLASSVDESTGTVTLKHLETQMNTVTPLITYLFRSNTDTTSLRSGTAIKAVLYYISNYITKVSLKTHAVFEAIRSIFRRNVEFISETRPKAEKCRILMTKMVNSMTAKMEIGAPMASLYLLGKADHYTDCRFQPFYWTNYVQEVNSSWNYPIPIKNAEKVPIFKRGKRYTGVSHVEDYCKRATELESTCLYDWISYSKRQKTANVITPDDLADYHDDDDDAPNQSIDTTDSSADDQVKKHLYQFLPSHPLHKTYKTYFNKNKTPTIPTFLGPALPRSSTGDREFYCMTMLTLFVPWRTGKSLKSDTETWAAAFSRATFTQKQLDILSNFDIQYECRDASDDYFAQMKKGSDAEVPVPGFIDNATEDPNMTTWTQDLSSPDNVHEESENVDEFDLSLEQLGRNYLRRQTKFEITKTLLDHWGMNMARPNLATRSKSDYAGPEKFRTPQQWESLLYNTKSSIQDAKKANVPADKGFPKPVSNKNVDRIDIVTREYLQKSFNPKKWQSTIRKIKSKFSLNKEQTRAFRIVANHASSDCTEQLRMYIAGMGGTGKSQVLKALKAYFEHRKESYRFIVVAPTGSAAALLHGNTYHSAFGINDRWEASEKNLSVLRERLKGLQYVFFDEVSMLSCRELYRISRQLARITGESESPFGNMNMIFAGDFAQLPPPVGGEKASLFSRHVGWSANSLFDQESAIGKAIWHQIDTVVILTENMRQRKQSKYDTKLRKALENMRYARCTPEDIAFLRTRISGEPPNPNITDPKFRNTSIITAHHIDKDAFNEVGCQRWAEEHDQPLHSFVSEDETADQRSDRLGKKRKTNNKPALKMTPERRKQLWEQPSASTSLKIPGTLKICRGMPVMIHYNFATDLCMTRGQDAKVVDWIDKETHFGRRALATLFVELIDPPRDVKLDGLPRNVVPIPQTTNAMKAYLKDDSEISIYRSQVDVAPNFGMTDFASQGKTRPENPSDLSNLSTHYAYYTALSRSSTAAGTLILQGFDPKIITKGISGALRQEFRELEILNEITMLRYEEKLPLTFDATRTRNSLIELYRYFKGSEYIPENLHTCLKWSTKDPFLQPTNDNVKWSDNPTNEQHTSEQRVQKRAIEDGDSNDRTIKRPKLNKTDNKSEYKTMLDEELTQKQCRSRGKEMRSKFQSTTIEHKIETEPIGSHWNDNSCAYDAVITALYNLWLLDERVSQTFSSASNELKSLARDFNNTKHHKCSLDTARDNLCARLQTHDPVKFQRGLFASVSDILDVVLHLQTPVTATVYRCPNPNCMNTEANERVHYAYSAHVDIEPYRINSIQQFVRGCKTDRSSKCSQCMTSMISSISFLDSPPILCFNLCGRSPTLNATVTIQRDITDHIYRLRGIIYYKNNHFTTRIINNLQEVWHHDGMRTVNTITYEGSLNRLNLKNRDGAIPSVAIYVIT